MPILKEKFGKAMGGLERMFQVKPPPVIGVDISTSAVTQRKRTAQWNAIEKTVIYFEKTMQRLIK